MWCRATKERQIGRSSAPPMMEATIQPSLQWSHRISAVVTGRLDSVPDEEKGLQWSHRLSAVVTVD